MIGFILAFFFARDVNVYLPCTRGLTVEYAGVVDTIVGYTDPHEPRLCVIARRGAVSWAREQLTDRVSYAGEVDALVALRPPMLKAPLYTGAHWRFDRTDYAIVAVGRPVTVPAGTFSDTVWIEETSESGRATSVYVAGIGLVRHERGATIMQAVRVLRPSTP